MKLLLYCTKAKPYLTMTTDFVSFKHFDCYNEDLGCLNGKVIAECDFEVERIIYRETDKNNYSFGTDTLTPDELLDKSCLTILELCKYIGSNPNWVKGDYGYAIHIKNLKIYDKPKELNEYYKILSSKEYDTKINKLGYRPKEWLNVPVSETKYFAIQSILEPLKNAPQNMMYVCEYDKSTSVEDYYKRNILVSIRPDWLYQILNGKKTIEVRKKVLRRML